MAVRRETLVDLEKPITDYPALHGPIPARRERKQIKRRVRVATGQRAQCQNPECKSLNVSKNGRKTEHADRSLSQYWMCWDCRQGYLQRDEVAQDEPRELLDGVTLEE